MTAFTLFSQGTAGSLATDNSDYTMGVQFTVSQSATLTGIWFNSAAGAAGLPVTIALYAVSGTSLVHSEGTTVTPITWSGIAGSGWVKATFASPPALTASTSYKAAVFANAPGGNWYSATANYWSSGAGASGITNGPLTATNNAGGDGGQDTFTQSNSLAYPSSSFNAGNYWVDPEVTTGSTAVSGADTGSGADTASVAVAVSGADTAAGADTATLHAALTGSDTASGADTGSAAAALTGADTAAGTDTATVAVAVSGSDTAAGADTASVNGVPISGADTGSGADTASVAVAVSGADTAAGTDTGSVAAAVSAADTATAADTASVSTPGPPPSGGTGPGLFLAFFP